MSTAASPLRRRVQRALKRHEKDENTQVAAFFGDLGMVVCSTQQWRPSMQFEGIPDYWVFDPLRIPLERNAGQPFDRFFWWEGKAVDGEQSVKQKHFQILCGRCLVPYGIGTLVDAIDWVRGWRGKTIKAPPGCERWRNTRESA